MRFGKFISKNSVINLNDLEDFNLIKLKKYKTKDKKTPYILEATYKSKIKRYFIGILNKTEFTLHYEIGEGELID